MRTEGETISCEWKAYSSRIRYFRKNCVLKHLFARKQSERNVRLMHPLCVELSVLGWIDADRNRERIEYNARPDLQNVTFFSLPSYEHCSIHRRFQVSASYLNLVRNATGVSDFSFNRACVVRELAKTTLFPWTCETTIKHAHKINSQKNMHMWKEWKLLDIMETGNWLNWTCGPNLCVVRPWQYRRNYSGVFRNLLLGSSSGRCNPLPCPKFG